MDSRFKPAAQAFLDGFEAGRDVGAAVCVLLDGQPVLDIWHGHCDRRLQLEWGEDTLVCMFSVTKAVTSVCLLHAVDQGLVDLDAPVTRYWPEFAANGKDAVSVRHLLSHQAGLVGFHDPVDRDMLYDWPRVTRALEQEALWWPPGSRHGYHARTFGFLLGEVIRRSTGETPGSWLRSRICQPLGLDFHIGLATPDLQRCADVLPARVRPGQSRVWSPAMRAMLQDFKDLSTPTGAAFQNPAMPAGYMNTAIFRQAEIPALNGHGTARSVAGLYHHLHEILAADTIAEATSTQSLGPDEVLKAVTHFGLGLMLHHEESPIGLRPGSFGHAGAGGSMGFHDPAARLSFCFAMNQMEEGVVTGGTSATAVAQAVYDCL